jgi:hypothetical protein
VADYAKADAQTQLTIDHGIIFNDGHSILPEKKVERVECKKGI